MEQQINSTGMCSITAEFDPQSDPPVIHISIDYETDRRTLSLAGGLGGRTATEQVHEEAHRIMAEDVLRELADLLGQTGTVPDIVVERVGEDVSEQGQALAQALQQKLRERVQAMSNRVVETETVASTLRVQPQ